MVLMEVGGEHIQPSSSPVDSDGAEGVDQDDQVIVFDDECAVMEEFHIHHAFMLAHRG